MTKKRILRMAKLQFFGNQAKPGPALASTGVNIMEFCNQFNRASENRKEEIVPVVLTVFEDKTFSFILKTTPTAKLIKKYLNLDKAAKNSKTEKIGSLTQKQIEEIATYKMPDLNTDDLASAVKIVLGTMKQMGVTLKKEGN